MGSGSKSSGVGEGDCGGSVCARGDSEQGDSERGVSECGECERDASGANVSWRASLSLWAIIASISSTVTLSATASVLRRCAGGGVGGRRKRLSVPCIAVLGVAAGVDAGPGSWLKGCHAGVQGFSEVSDCWLACGAT